MEKQDVPNARDEIRKLQEALKGKAEDPGFADRTKAKKARVGRKGLQDANGTQPKVDEANTKEIKE
jgi:hypothetical protein